MMFDEIHQRNVVSWTAMMTGYIKSDYPGKAVLLFKGLLVEEKDELYLDSVAMVSILSACRMFLIGLAHKKENFTGIWVLVTLVTDVHAKCGQVELLI